MTFDEGQIAQRRSLGGGCISTTEHLTLSDGREFCLKSHGGSQGAEMLRVEAEGLRVLSSERGPRVPKVHGTWVESGTAFLLTEYIGSGRMPTQFDSAFGARLARMHHDKPGKRFGFDRNNYIGTTEQRNTWHSSWIAFFATERLGFQLSLAKASGRADGKLLHSVESVIDRLDSLLIEPEVPSLLHGDLWSGNVMCDREGNPVIIDPAVYYGHREADLAMTELFGGFSRSFYEAYSAEWSLEPGYRERRDIYNLYHMLNHLNIFGSGYAGAVERLCRPFCRG